MQFFRDKSLSMQHIFFVAVCLIRHLRTCDVTQKYHPSNNNFNGIPYSLHRLRKRIAIARRWSHQMRWPQNYCIGMSHRWGNLFITDTMVCPHPKNDSHNSCPDDSMRMGAHGVLEMEYLCVPNILLDDSQRDFNLVVERVLCLCVVCSFFFIILCCSAVFALWQKLWMISWNAKSFNIIKNLIKKHSSPMKKNAKRWVSQPEEWHERELYNNNNNEIRNSWYCYFCAEIHSRV